MPIPFKTSLRMLAALAAIKLGSAVAAQTPPPVDLPGRGAVPPVIDIPLEKSTPMQPDHGAAPGPGSGHFREAAHAPAFNPAPDHAESINAAQKALKACYRFKARPRSEYPGMDVILLQPGGHLKLAAGIETLREPGEGWVEKSRRIRWSASDGEVAHLTRGGYVVEGQAWLAPPDAGGLITLRADCELDFRRILPSGDFEMETVHFARAFRVLSPEPGSSLQGGMINGYKIGEYPDPTDRELEKRYNVNSSWHHVYPDRYSVPDGFYCVESYMKDWRIAPHQTLGTWTIDFPWYSLGMPQYIALDWNLVRKIEDLRDLMADDGFAITSFVPIYGFRPPAFNLGTIDSQPDTNLKMPFSQHQFGRAIDLIVDEDGDGVLDDLNGDGVADIHDAAVIMYYVNLLDRRYREEGRMAMVGGAGVYTDNDFVQRPWQSPYIHIDTRGFLNSRGNLIRWTSGSMVANESVWPDGTTVRFGAINRQGFDR